MLDKGFWFEVEFARLSSSFLFSPTEAAFNGLLFGSTSDNFVNANNNKLYYTSFKQIPN